MANPLTDFFECEFPTSLAFLCQGGPTFSSTINTSFAGDEYRVRNWTGALSKWVVDLTNKPVALYSQVEAFFYCVGGQACAFRFLNHLDFQATNQVIGLGDGITAVFQLQTSYTSGMRTFTRNVVKPITSAVMKFDGSYCADTVSIYVNGASTTAFSLDPTTGLVSFETAPAATSVISWSGQFHFPVRFTSDELKATIEPSFVSGGEAIVSWSQIEIKETRDFQ
jgi:uncharacterized protein (TIGR02217 family)